MKALFCTFLGFFHGCELFFTGMFSEIFTGRLMFSLVVFEVFLRVKVDFTGRKFIIFHG